MSGRRSNREVISAAEDVLGDSGVTQWSIDNKSRHNCIVVAGIARKFMMPRHFNNERAKQNFIHQLRRFVRQLGGQS